MSAQRHRMTHTSAGFIGTAGHYRKNHCLHCRNVQITGKHWRRSGATTPAREGAVARRRRQRPATSAVLGGSVGAVTASQAAAGHNLGLVIGTGLPTTVLAWAGGQGVNAIGDPNGPDVFTPLTWVLGALAGLAVSHLAQQSPASLRKAWIRITRGTDQRGAQPNCPACDGEGTIECLCQRWSVPTANERSTRDKQSGAVNSRGAVPGLGLFSKGRVRVSASKANCPRCRGTGRERCPRCGGGGTLVHSDEASLRGDTVPVHLEDGYDWDRAARLKRDSN
jgi:hypothetical protein